MDIENGPLVTAVVPAYNHEQYVTESIRSIIDQTYRNIELIVINDGSQDNSHQKILPLIPECQQRFVRFAYINRENVGVSATLNQALAWANGKYFSPLASDDIALPEKFSSLVEALESWDRRCAAAFGDALFIDGNGKRMNIEIDGKAYTKKKSKSYSTFLEFYTRNRDFDYRGPEFGTYQTLLVANYLPAMSSVVRISEIREAGGWTNENPLEDWELWLKLSQINNLLYVDKPLALYRLHGKNSTNIKRYELNYASMTLIVEQKEYCVRHNLMPIWKESINCRFFELFKSKSFFKKESAIHIRFIDLFSFTYFLIKKIGRRSQKLPTLR